MTNGILDSGQKIITNGLVLNYDMAQLRSYPTTGTTIKDLSGNSNNGSLINGVGFNSNNGGSLFFDGLNDYISIQSSPTIETQEFTYCFWVYPLSSTYLTLKGSSLVSGAPQFRIQGITGNLILIKQNIFGFPESTIPVNFNQWNYLCVSYSSPIVSYYINGTSAGTASSAQTFTNFGNTLIGARVSAIEYFKGNIGITQIYNKVLTSVEILQNFDATKKRYGL